MASQPISTTITQQVPDHFAEDLRMLHEAKDPRLNTVLAKAREIGWHASTTGAVIGVTAAAASKRMERAVPPPWPLEMREKARITERELRAIVANYGIPGNDLETFAAVEADIDYLLEVRLGEGTATRDDVVAVAQSARDRFHTLATIAEEKSTPRVARRWRTLRDRTAAAIAYEPGPSPSVDEVDPDTAWRGLAADAVRSASRVIGWLAETYPQLDEAVFTDVTVRLEGLLAALAEPDGTWQVDALRDLVSDASGAVSRLKAVVPVSEPSSLESEENRMGAVRRLIRAAARLQMTAEFDPAGVVVEGILIPRPPRLQRTQRGRALPDDVVQRLRRLQQTARRVNGTTKPDSPEWAASVELSEMLFALTHPSDGSQAYPAYYLAKVLGVTHRAVIARLERLKASQERAAA